MAEAHVGQETVVMAGVKVGLEDSNHHTGLYPTMVLHPVPTPTAAMYQYTYPRRFFP